MSNIIDAIKQEIASHGLTVRSVHFSFVEPEIGLYRHNETWSISMMVDGIKHLPLDFVVVGADPVTGKTLRATLGGASTEYRYPALACVAYDFRVWESVNG